ncbi:MAG: PHP domain-containing protein [Methanobacteriaceae archaeon]|nr:PHP domain-containing protein [Methanobacteriaceae archaeon]
MMRYDLHVHSKYSCDGFIEPAKIVETAKKRGLSGIAITDHDTIKGGLMAKKYQDQDFEVIIGSEITTNQGEIIGLFLNQEINSKDHLEVMDEIKDQDGLVIIPHPFDNMRQATYHPLKDNFKYFDGLEVFNSRCISQKYNDKAEAFANKFNLNKCAGSDAHFINEIGNAGVIAGDELRKSLKNNQLEIFGSRSSLFNHGFTKVVKWYRKII